MDIPWFSDVPDEPRRPRGTERGIGDGQEPEDLDRLAAREIDERRPEWEKAYHGPDAEQIEPERPEADALGDTDAEDATAREAAERELTAVQQDFDTKLEEQLSRNDAAVEKVDERTGEDREDSLKQLDEAAKALADLKYEYEQSARNAASDRLPEEVRKRIADYCDKIDQKCEALDQRSRELRQEESAEREHVLRIPGLVEIDAPSIERVIITHLVRIVAIVAANHIVPGHGTEVVRAFETLIKVGTAPEKLDNASGVEISVPFTFCDGMFSLNIGTRLADDPGPPGSMPLILTVGPNFGGQPASHRPQVALVDAVPLPGKTPQYDEDGIKELIEAEHRRHSEARKKLLESARTAPDETAAADGSDEAVAQESSPATGEAAGEANVRPPDESGSERPAEPKAEQHEEATAGETRETRAEQHQAAGHEQPGQGAIGQPERSAVGQPEPGSTQGATRQPSRPRPTGVVIWGSAQAIAVAARSGLLSPELLLSLARKEVWDQLFDGKPESVVAAVDAVRSLEVIVFLDFDIGGGLWIDVDPVTQEPCATLLVDMKFSGSELERFRLFYVTP